MNRLILNPTDSGRLITLNYSYCNRLLSVCEFSQFFLFNYLLNSIKSKAMKSILFLILVIPFLANAQSNSTPENETSDATLKKSAEDFVLNWFNCFETKNWDNFSDYFFEDAQLYTPAKTTLIKEVSKSLIDQYTNVVTQCDTKIESMSTEVIGQDAALVTVRYLETDVVKGSPVYFDYLDNYLLEKQNDNWKIKRLISNYSQPVLFGNSVASNWKKGKVEPFYRFNGAVGQMAGISFYFMEDYKKKGITPAQLGTEIGSRFASYWDQSKGFNGLASGFIWNIQTTVPYLEVLERNETILKMKFENAFVPNEKRWDLTNQEVLDYFRNAFGAIAEHMGGTCNIEEDGKYYLMTLNKK